MAMILPDRSRPWRAARYAIPHMPLFRRKNHAATGSTGPPPARTSTGSARPPELHWRSYDLVAQTYKGVFERITGPPAQELVRLLDIKPGSRVLDVGTG